MARERKARSNAVARPWPAGLLVLCLSLAGPLGATSPSQIVAPSFHQDAETLYVAWGGVYPSAGRAKRTALTAIDLSNGRALWSIEGAIQLTVGRWGSLATTEIPKDGSLLFVSGFWETRYGGFAIDTDRAGQVSWSSSHAFIAVGAGLVLTSSGQALNSQTGEQVWDGLVCQSAVFRQDPSELICLAREDHPYPPGGCEWSLSRHRLSDGAMIGSATSLGCRSADIVALFRKQVLLRVERSSLLVSELESDRPAARFSCSNQIFVHAKSQTAICSNYAESRATEIDFVHGRRTHHQGFRLPWARLPRQPVSGALVGWSDPARAPALYRPGGEPLPLTAAGEIDQMRMAWFGPGEVVYVMSGDFQLVRIDAKQRRITWRTVQINQQRAGVPLWLWDLGDRAGAVFPGGVVVPFDARSGERLARHYTQDSLVVAVTWEDEEELDRLLAKGLDPNEIDPTQPNYPLRGAVASGHVAITKKLLDAGSRIDGHGHRRPLLHVAATMGNAEVVELLLDAGSHPRQRDEYRRTALDWAKERGHEEVVEILAAAQRSRWRQR